MANIKHQLYMDEKRAHDNMIDDKQELFFDSLSEIAEAVGHSLRNPVSVSLLCLRFGITNKEKGELWVAFNQVLRENESDQLSIQLFRKELEDIVPRVIPRVREFADMIVIAFIKGFARNYIAALEPFARSLYIPYDED